MYCCDVAVGILIVGKSPHIHERNAPPPSPLLRVFYVVLLSAGGALGSLSGVPQARQLVLGPRRNGREPAGTGGAGGMSKPHAGLASARAAARVVHH